MKIKAMGSVALLGLVVVLGMGLSVPAAGGSPAEGVSLFNGKDLDGWHKPMGVHEDYRGGKWEVVDGVLLGDQDPPGKGGFLVTDGIYRDYVIEFDVKLDDPADSGVFLRMGEDGKNHQVTLDNDESKKFGWIYLSWGKVKITIWTHKIDGLTESDFVFAAKADQRLDPDAAGNS